MGFSTVPCNEFVEVLGSKAPVPGGVDRHVEFFEQVRHRFRAAAELLHWLALSAQRLATWLVR